MQQGGVVVTGCGVRAGHGHGGGDRERSLAQLNGPLDVVSEIRPGVRTPADS